MTRLRQHILLALLLAVFGAFLLLPIYRVLRVAFFGDAAPGDAPHFSFGYIAAVFRDRELRGGLFNAARIAVGVTILCTMISVPLAVRPSESGLSASPVPQVTTR